MTSPTVRVSLREVREHAFRALRVDGASPGEARVAAEQLVTAQVHDHTALDRFHERAQPWPSPGLHDHGGRARVRTVSSRRPIDVLADGALLCDLATATGQVVVVSSPTLTPVSALWDRLLLDSVHHAGRPATVWSGHRLRSARPGGEVLALAAGAPRPSTDLVVWCGAPDPDGVVVTHRHDSDTLRRSAALGGLHVPADAWERLRTSARRFLIPE